MQPKQMFLAFFAAFLFLAPAGAAEKRFTIPLGDSPSLGPVEAPVTIIEFIDFQ